MPQPSPRIIEPSSSTHDLDSLADECSSGILFWGSVKWHLLLALCLSIIRLYHQLRCNVRLRTGKTISTGTPHMPPAQVNPSSRCEETCPPAELWPRLRSIPYSCVCDSMGTAGSFAGTVCAPQRNPAQQWGGAQRPTLQQPQTRSGWAPPVYRPRPPARRHPRKRPRRLIMVAGVLLLLLPTIVFIAFDIGQTPLEGGSSARRRSSGTGRDASDFQDPSVIPSPANYTQAVKWTASNSLYSQEMSSTAD